MTRDDSADRRIHEIVSILNMVYKRQTSGRHLTLLLSLVQFTAHKTHIEALTIPKRNKQNEASEGSRSKHLS